MRKHTLGTWHAARKSGDDQGLVIVEETGLPVAVTYQGAADATLIAAAPGLLAACKMALYELECIPASSASLYRALIEAVQKAEGR